MTDTSTKNDYSSTLYLPQTEFPMRAGLPQKEPELAARWKNMELYKKLRSSAAGRPKFVLHDGPPYANGNIHIGHALNKILKDVITRSFQMRGFDSNYVPGWDCHGLPIEWKIEEKYRAKGKNKDDIPINEFRKECRDFAAEWIKVQSAEFQRLGIEGDFDNPYTTMAFHAESRIAGELLKIAKSGQLYRGSKPIMWSVVERTALAEAEVEYQDYESDTIWVKFPVVKATVFAPDIISGNKKAIMNPEKMPSDLLGTSVVIWTTTPWTIPGNRAISFSSRYAYGLYEVTGAENDFGPQPGEKLIFAKRLAEDCGTKAKVTLALVRDVKSDELEALVCAHPLASWSPSSGPADHLLPAGEKREPGAASVSSSPQRGEGGATAPGEGELPSHKQGVGYTFAVPLLDGDHVTDDAGTGFVHTAPGHGREDFDIWMEKARELEARGISSKIPFTVDDAGFLTKDAPGFGPDAEGGPARVIDDAGKKGDANPRVIKALIETNALFARGRLKHTYPHSWRSGKPVIFRNTPQWFVYMDKELGENSPSSALRAPSPRKQGEGVAASAEIPLSPQAGRGSGNAGGEGQTSATPHPEVHSQQATGTPHPEVHAQHASKGEGHTTLRSTALKAIDDTRFVPAAGQNRLRAMIEGRPDWVLSRQRAWGVPICVFADVDGNILDDDAVNARILEAFEKEGADAWFADGAKERFLGNEHDPARWVQVRDILDVWFDSGSTHTFTLEDRPDLKWPADVYLEGSDQHRGWFHSSLLESCATRGRAPYNTVVTHGFIMDEKGEKMSKSKGNVVAPQDIMKEAGADILRLWVMTSDYAEDLRVGKTIIQTNIDAYRKIRNTIRWILGTLAHDKGEEIALNDMPELEQLMLHRLSELDHVVRDGYDAFDFKKISRALIDFMNVELSAFYFDVRKDTLYCDAPSSLKRRASLHVIRKIFECLVTWFAPMLPFTTEEAWLSRNPSATSVHLEQFPAIPAEWKNEALADKWKKIRTVRKAVTGALEIERAAKTIGSSLEAAPVVYVNDPVLLEALGGQDFAEICITSGITIRSDEAPEGAFKLDDGTRVAVVPSLAEGTKCARSWRITTDVGSDSDYPDVSARDATALRELAAMK